jgi:hypothetical protein
MAKLGDRGQKAFMDIFRVHSRESMSQGGAISEKQEKRFDSM